MDDLALHGTAVGLLHSVWVALNTAEYVAWQELTSGVETMPSMGINIETKALTVAMWTVCL